MKKTILTYLILTMTASSSFAWSCIQETWVPLSMKKQFIGSCKVQDPLLLAKANQSYPLLNSEIFPVQYWQGSFSKEVQQTTKALHEIYDECSRRTILSRIEVSHENLNLFFRMKNPNLKSDVDATYKLVPMTLAEAQTEWQRTEQRCLKAR